MSTFTRFALIFALFASSSFAYENEGTKENYYLCNVEISQDSKTLSKHLITTFRSVATKINPDYRPYHDSYTILSECILQPFNKKRNARVLHFNTDKNKYVDLCYKIRNGVSEELDGEIELYVNERSEKEFYKLNYLNRNRPIKLTGHKSVTRKVREYTVKTDCENKMLQPQDPLWREIYLDMFK